MREGKSERETGAPGAPVSYQRLADLGYIAGLLAQPEWQEDPLRTLAYAVWQHGAAADALQARRGNWMVEDLVDEIGNVRP